MICVYVIENLKTNKHYVGQTSHDIFKRIYHHIALANRGGGYIFHKSLRKYGTGSFILKETRYAEPNQADYLERDLIVKYNSRIPNGYNILAYGQLYNGPGAWLGRKRDLETNKKISETRKGTFKGEDNHFYGKKHSKQSLKKMSIAQKKRWANLSDEERKAYNEKCAKARTGQKRTKDQVKNIIQGIRDNLPEEKIRFVIEVKKMIRAGYTNADIARKFKCNPSNISNIKQEVHYSWIQIPEGE